MRNVSGDGGTTFLWEATGFLAGVRGKLVTGLCDCILLICR